MSSSPAPQDRSYVAVIDREGMISVVTLEPSISLKACLSQLRAQMEGQSKALPTKLAEIRIFETPHLDPVFYYDERAPPSQSQLKQTFPSRKFSTFRELRCTEDSIMSQLSHGSLTDLHICFLIVDLEYIIYPFKPSSSTNVWNHLLHINQKLPEWSFDDIAGNNGHFLTIDNRSEIPSFVHDFLEDRRRAWHIEASPHAFVAELVQILQQSGPNPTLAMSLACVPEMSKLFIEAIGQISDEDRQNHTPDDDSLYGLLLAFLMGRIYIPRALTSSSYARESAIGPLFSMLQCTSASTNDDIKFFHSQQDPNCAFLVSQGSKLSRYSPASDSALTFKGIVFIRLEVESGTNKADKWRMLAQSISNNRVATHLLHKACDGKPILTFAFYVDRELRVTEYILWSEPLTENTSKQPEDAMPPFKVNIFTQTAAFDLALADTELSVVQFMKRLYHIKMFYEANYRPHIDDTKLKGMLNGMREFRSTMSVLDSYTSVKKTRSHMKSSPLTAGQEKQKSRSRGLSSLRTTLGTA